MSTELAFILGAYASEGHTSRSNWSVIITNSVMAVLERVQAAWRAVFGLEARITQQPGRCPGVAVSSKRLVEFSELLGCGSRAANKRIPECIGASTKEHVLAFIQSLTLDAYITSGESAKWAICLESKSAIDHLQQLMTRLGVFSSQIGTYNAKMNKHYPLLYAAGPWGQKMCQLVPFLEPEKAERARVLCSQEFLNNAADVIPGLSGRALYNLIPKGRPGRGGYSSGRRDFTFLLDPRSRHVSRRSVERLRELGVPVPAWAMDVLDQQVHFVPVNSVAWRY